MSFSSEVDVNFLQVFRRHIGKMLLVFVLVVAAVCSYFVVANRLYTSEARVFVRLGRETAGLDATSASNQVMSAPDARENEINTVQQLILSRTVAEEVVDAVGVEAILESHPGPEGAERRIAGVKLGIMSRINEFLALPAEEPRESAIGKFQKRLKVQTSEHSSVIAVSYQCGSADLGTKVLTAVLVSARRGHIRINRVDGSDNFFAEQSDLWKKEVNRLEEAMRTFRNTSGISNVALQREIKLNHIAKLKIALLENEAEVKASEAQLAKQESILGTEPEHLIVSRISDMPNSAVQGMQQQLFTVKLKEAELLSKFNIEHVLVKEAREQVDAASRALKQVSSLTQVTEGMNQVRQELRAAMLNQKASVAGLRAKSDALRAEFAATQNEMKTLNEQQPRLDQLTGELDLAQASYRGYYQKHEQARIDQAAQNESISNLNILQPPSGSRLPTWPQPMATVALGTLLALVASAAAAITAEYSRPTRKPASLPTIPPPHRSLHAPSNGAVVRA